MQYLLSNWQNKSVKKKYASFFGDLSPGFNMSVADMEFGPGFDLICCLTSYSLISTIININMNCLDASNTIFHMDTG